MSCVFGMHHVRSVPACPPSRHGPWAAEPPTSPSPSAKKRLLRPATDVQLLLARLSEAMHSRPHPLGIRQSFALTVARLSGTEYVIPQPILGAIEPQASLSRSCKRQRRHSSPPARWRERHGERPQLESLQLGKLHSRDGALPPEGGKALSWRSLGEELRAELRTLLEVHGWEAAPADPRADAEGERPPHRVALWPPRGRSMGLPALIVEVFSSYPNESALAMVDPGRSGFESALCANVAALAAASSKLRMAVKAAQQPTSLSFLCHAWRCASAGCMANI